MKYRMSFVFVSLLLVASLLTMATAQTNAHPDMQETGKGCLMIPWSNETP